MKSNWQNVKLNELGFLGRGKSRHRPRNEPSLYGGPYPFIQTGEIKAADLYINSFSQTYSEKGLAQSKLWNPGTLCITIAANVAETAILNIEACFPDSVVGFIADPDKSDVRFIKYYIDTIKLRMQSISRGTTQDNLSLEKIDTFDFFVPYVKEQQRIASILSAYDDLIDNNTRRIKILEDMAKLIYREWFVEFKAPGVKLRKATAEEKKVTGKDQFPEGWEVKKLGDFIELAYGKGLKSEERSNNGFPVYGSSGIIGFHQNALVKGPGIIVGRKGNVGSVFWCFEDFYPIDTVFFVKTNVSLYYIFYNLSNQKFLNSDAAVPGLNRESALLKVSLLPDKNLIYSFEITMTPIFKQIKLLETKIKNLRCTRDLLLPKLVSGEIEV